MQLKESEILTVNHFRYNKDMCLQEIWENLFERSSKNIFISWSWISAWLDFLPCPPIVLEAKKGGKTIGLAMFCQSTKVIFPYLKIEQLWLHKTGNQIFDQIWIEHNDFLTDEMFDVDAKLAMWSYLKEKRYLWDETYIGLSTVKTLNQFDSTKLIKRIDVSSPSFEVSLTGLTDLSSYLKDLSKNTRSQILRSKKLLEEQGNIELVEAGSKEERQLFLDDITNIHIKKWSESEFGSGFSNKHFRQFHEKIILHQDQDNLSALFCLKLNKNALAYLYILKDQKCWNFYLSAIKTHSDNKIKIGLLIHALVVELAIKSGAHKYRFLAGEARYKRSLSNSKVYQQQVICFIRPHLNLIFRELLRTLKNSLLNLVPKK